MKPERIAKVIAASGLCSRREAEAWLQAGRVTLNGQLQTSPAHTVTPEDVILVDDKPLITPDIPRLFAYHKPVGELCTTRDPQGRKTVYDNLPSNLPRVVSVGRLDLNSAGLLLFTTSGAVAEALMRSDLPRTYRVRVQGDITPAKIGRLTRGMTIEGTHYRPMQVVYDPSQKTGQNQWLTLTLTEGKNREIRKVCAELGWQVSRLLRLSYGPFQLGKLAEGEVKEIPQRNMNQALEGL